MLPNMADKITKTAGSKAVNAFPAIAFLITLGMAVLIWLNPWN
jgi:hypothetical protein